jgi:hypothetical protein
VSASASGALGGARNPLWLAQTCGLASNGFVGRKVFLGMEVMFILRATRKPTFSGRMPGMRLRHNVILTGPPGVGKSFMCEAFYEKACNAANLMGSKAWAGGRPRVFFVEGEASWEKMRGGATSSGEPIRPAVLDADFVHLTEMNTVFGEHPRQDMKLIRKYGVLAEERRMTVSFKMMDEMDKETAKEFAESCKDWENFEFSLDPRGYTFWSDAAHSICTTILDEEHERKLRDSGYLSRFDVLSIESTNSEQIEMLENFGRGSPPDYGELAAINADIWHTKFCDIDYPPDELLGADAQAWLVREVERISKEFGLPPLAFANLRDIGHLARLMAASAISRIFEKRERGDRSPVTSIPYGKEDVAFAKWYVQAHLGRLRLQLSDSRRTMEYDAPRDAVSALADAVKAAIGDDVHYELNDIGVGLRDYRAIVVGKYKKNEGTAKNYCIALRKAGLVAYSSGDDRMRVDGSFCGRILPDPAIRRAAIAEELVA